MSSFYGFLPGHPRVSGCIQNIFLRSRTKVRERWEVLNQDFPDFKIFRILILLMLFFGARQSVPSFHPLIPDSESFFPTKSAYRIAACFTSFSIDLENAENL